MPISTEHWKIQTNTKSAYKRPQQYIYHNCRLGHVSPSLGLLVSVYIFMLPMLGLVDEHAQLTAAKPINQWSVHMTYSHKPLVLPSLNNLLPAMVLQNKGVRSNIRCPSYTSSHSGLPSFAFSRCFNFSSCLGRRVGVVVVSLLLLLSGDIETNPGPVGEFLHGSCFDKCVNTVLDL